MYVDHVSAVGGRTHRGGNCTPIGAALTAWRTVPDAYEASGTVLLRGAQNGASPVYGGETGLMWQPAP
jgi:hypothetical protein